MFVGREQELDFLRRRYDSGSFEFIGIYGRRRVGKTTLIGEFSKGLPCGWCVAAEEDATFNLRALSQAVYALQAPDADQSLAPTYPDYRAAFDAAFSVARDRQAVLVIDEYPYLVAADPSVSSMLQASIDANRDNSKLFLILCGSSLSFMKEQLLDRKSPLYGRRTGQIELKPFDFFDARRFFPRRSFEEAADIYGMVGGIPLYLARFQGEGSLGDAVAAEFLDPDAMLYEEPSNLLKQEVSKPAVYNAVMSAIASGSSQYNEIATQAHISSGGLEYYLKELSRIGLVGREVPITGGGSRKALWNITDNLFRFWYRFVRPRRALVERGMGERALPAIREGLPQYMGPVFEEICRQWLWREFAAGRLSFDFTDVGRWWGNDPVARSEAEIDIVAVNDQEVSLVGECKWQNEPTGADQLAKLDHRAGLVGAGSSVPRWMFSKSGYAQGCIDLASELPAARLVTLGDME